MTYSLECLDQVLAQDRPLVEFLAIWKPEWVWIWPAPLYDVDSAMTAVVLIPASRILALIPIVLDPHGALWIQRAHDPVWADISTEDVHNWMADARGHRELLENALESLAVTAWGRERISHLLGTSPCRRRSALRNAKR